MEFHDPHPYEIFNFFGHLAIFFEKKREKKDVFREFPEVENDSRPSKVTYTPVFGVWESEFHTFKSRNIDFVLEKANFWVFGVPQAHFGPFCEHFSVKKWSKMVKILTFQCWLWDHVFEIGEPEKCVFTAIWGGFEPEIDPF